MDLLEAIRRRARRDRRAFIDGGCPPHGDDFLDAIARLLDVVIVPVAHGDVLVQGARAKLELDSGMRLLYVDASLAPAQRTFCTAHELAHLRLHGGDELCGAPDDEPSDDAAQERRDHTLEVYNPRQQREREANAYALELLAPRDRLIEEYLGEPGSTSVALGERFGVSQHNALSQLVAAMSARRPTVDHRGLPHRDRITGQDPELDGAAEDFIASLDDDQKIAVTVDPGPVFVEAGPGSGKTRTLVARVAWLLRERRVAPERLLVLTFSNDATGELRERLALALGRQATMVTVATFHAFARDLLRRYGEATGARGDVEVIDSIDARRLVRSHLAEMPLHHYARPGNPSWFVPDLLRAVSRAKDSLVGPEAYAHAARAALAAASDDEATAHAERQLEVAAFYAAYQKLLASQGVADFGDLLMSVVDLLRRDATVATELRDRYRHVLVDEYQDVNAACHALVESLAGPGEGLWVVGDPRQAIYAFRGATAALLDRFRGRFPATTYVALTSNYRSSELLTSLFDTIAARSPSTALELPHVRADHVPRQRNVVWAVAKDERSEHSGLIARIEELAASGVGLSDQAVLCRTNGRARSVARALETAGIEVVAASGAFDRPEVKHLLAVLSVLCDDGLGLMRLREVPEHRFDVTTARCAISRAIETGTGLLDLLAGSDSLEPVPPNDRDALRRLAATLHGLEALTPWEALARYVFDRTAMARRLAHDGGADASSARGAVASLLAMARGFDARRWSSVAEATYTSAHHAFLDYVRFLIEEGADGRPAPRGGEGPAGIRVLTAHASKGLEFEAVHLPHLARGVWPPRHRPELCPGPPGLLLDDGEPSPPDSELFYVAMTRARGSLTLSRASNYGGRGAGPSRFWEMAAPHLRDVIGEPEVWEVADDHPPQATPHTPAADPIDAEAQALETYVACPRRYHYQYVAGLRPRGGELNGFAFRRCVSFVARQLGELRSAGRLPESSEDVDMLLRDAWSRHGLAGHPYEAIYWREARSMLTRCRTSLMEHPAAPDIGASVTVDLPSARVRLDIDRIDALPGGGLALVRYRSGNPSKEHAREPRIALYELAASELSRARGTPCRVDLEYLGTGERVEVPKPASGRASRGNGRSPSSEVEEAARGIARGRFEPLVSDLCRTCSFNLICPA